MTTSQPSTPCGDAKMATGKAANQTVKNQYDQIQAMTTSTGKEYGGEQNRAPLPAGGYMTPTVRTDSLTGSFLILLGIIRTDILLV